MFDIGDIVVYEGLLNLPKLPITYTVVDFKTYISSIDGYPNTRFKIKSNQTLKDGFYGIFEVDLEEIRLAKSMEKVLF